MPGGAAIVRAETSQVLEHGRTMSVPCWAVAHRDNGWRGFPMRLATSALALILASTLLAGCQSPDVGQRCELLWNTAPGAPPAADARPPSPPSTSRPATPPATTWSASSPRRLPAQRYYDCAGTQCGYCSKPCVSDKDCFKSETGLVCRQMVLDPAFIAGLDPDTRARYLADIQFSSYCAVPR